MSTSTQSSASPAIDIDALSRVLPVTRRRVSSGQHLFRAGQPFRAIHLVDQGSFKVCDLTEDGRERVTGFKMRHDLLGVESIGLPAHASDAIALEDSDAWVLPYPAVLRAATEVPALQEQINAALAAEIRFDRSWMLLLATLAAEPRVAAFLIDLAARHARLGMSARHFMLRMTRLDMASFLALQHETVSRVLGRLAHMHYIDVRRREVHLLDMDGLRAVAYAQAA